MNPVNVGLGIVAALIYVFLEFCSAGQAFQLEEGF